MKAVYDEYIITGKSTGDFFENIVEYRGNNSYINGIKNGLFIPEDSSPDNFLYNRGILPIIKNIANFENIFKAIIPSDIIDNIKSEHQTYEVLKAKISISATKDEFMNNTREFIAAFRNSNFLPLYHNGRDKVAIWTNFGMGVGDSGLIRTSDYKEYVNDSLSLLFTELWHIVPNCLFDAGEDLEKIKMAIGEGKVLSEPLQSTEFFRELFKKGVQIAKTWDPSAIKPAHIPHDMLLSQLFVESIPADKLKYVRIEFGQNLPLDIKTAIESKIGNNYTLLVNSCNVLANVELPEFLARVAQYNIHNRRVELNSEIITFDDIISREQTENPFKKEFLPLTSGGTPQKPGSIVHVSLKKLLSLVEEITELKNEKLEMEEVSKIIKKVIEDRNLIEAQRLHEEASKYEKYDEYHKAQWRLQNRPGIISRFSELIFTEEDKRNRQECEKEIGDLSVIFNKKKQDLEKQIKTYKGMFDNLSLDNYFIIKLLHHNSLSIIGKEIKDLNFNTDSNLILEKVKEYCQNNLDILQKESYTIDGERKEAIEKLRNRQKSEGKCEYIEKEEKQDKKVEEEWCGMIKIKKEKASEIRRNIKFDKNEYFGACVKRKEVDDDFATLGSI